MKLFSGILCTHVLKEYTVHYIHKTTGFLLYIYLYFTQSLHNMALDKLTTKRCMRVDSIVITPSVLVE